MKRRITIAPELVEPLRRYGERFMLSDLTDIANHLIRHCLVSPVPIAASPSKTVPATIAPTKVDTGNPLEDLSQLIGGL